MSKLAGLYRRLLEWLSPPSTVVALQSSQALLLGRASYLIDVETGSEYSHARMLRLSKWWARRFHDRGVRRGDHVAILLPGDAMFMYAFFAVLRLGAIAVPIDTRLKKGEVGRILERCRPKLIVSHLHFRALFSAPEPVLFMTDGAIAAAEKPSTSDPDPALALRLDADALAVKADDPACIIYTSGTTGEPKGAVITHRAIICRLDSLRHQHRLTPGRRKYWAWGFPGTWSLFRAGLFPLYHPGALILSAPADTPLNEDFPEVLRRFKVDCLQIPPGRLPRLLELLRDAGFASGERLRWINSCGGPVAAAFIAEFERVTGVPLIHEYGTTETGSITEQPLHFPDRAAGSVGKPFASWRIRVLDDGQIALKGPGLMTGYYQRPALTAEVMKDGWYHTGDIGRIDEKGHLFILGRVSDVIPTAQGKTYGAEIDALLGSHPGVRESVTVGRPDGPAAEKAVSFVVLKPGAVASESELIAHCHSRLMDYRCPVRIVFLDALPRTARDKIAKDLLPPD